MNRYPLPVIDAILRISLNAHQMGLKSITVFRDRSRRFKVLSCGAQQPC